MIPREWSQCINSHENYVFSKNLSLKIMWEISLSCVINISNTGRQNVTHTKYNEKKTIIK